MKACDNEGAKLRAKPTRAATPGQDKSQPHSPVSLDTSSYFETYVMPRVYRQNMSKPDVMRNERFLVDGARFHWTCPNWLFLSPPL